MVVTHRLRMDLAGKELIQWIDAVQGDVYARNVELHLFSGPREWPVPNDAAILIRYRKPDGKCGAYDTLPDGTAAWTVSGNKLTAVLVPQVLTTVGTVMLSISIAQKNKVINTFALEIRVREPLPENKKLLSGRKTEVSEDYYFVTGMLPVPDTAEAGQFIRIAAVNSQGKATRTEAVDMPQTGNVNPEEIQNYVWSYLRENPPADGKTPVKGEDYWTEAEIGEMYAHIDAEITNRFGKGTAIPAGADLNQYLDIGKYYASSNDIAGRITNCPTNQNFTMYVFVRTTVKSQMIIDLSGKLYIRSRTTTAWRDWVTYITKSDLSSAITEALTEAKESGEFETYTPVKGVDYWTDTERNAMLQDVIAALGTPVFGTVDASNNIILTGNLTDGTYTLQYENADGTKTVIGTLDMGNPSVFDVPITWIMGTKLDKTTGEVSATDDDTFNASGFIALEPNVSYAVSTTNDCYNAMHICYYDDSNAYVGYQENIWPWRECEISEGQPASGVLGIPDGATKIRLRHYEMAVNPGWSVPFIKLTGTRE